MNAKQASLPWIFVDGSTQQTFRIQLQPPRWEPPREQEDQDDAVCQFHITTDDGSAFAFQLQIVSDVLDQNEVRDWDSLRSLLRGKGVEIVEGAIHKGIRGDQALVWEPEGVSLVGGRG